MKITIDGKTFEAKPNSTVLQAARDNGIEIPTLCYDERLAPYGSCFLCVVEIEGVRGLKPACAALVTDGMIVRTQGDDIRRTRQMCLELLFSNHYGDCLAPCRMTCPAGLDIQGYLALTADGEYRKGIELVKSRIPFPAAIGRVCTRPCEDACRRNLHDERVGIDYVKRFLADTDMASAEPYRPQCRPDSGFHAAVIGGGPAGLTAAYFLRILGHAVTVYEAMPKLGGMLRYGIPEYRLPKQALDWEIDRILDLGVTVHTGMKFGRDITLEELRQQRFDAVFLGIGAWSSTKMRIANETAPGVLSGIDFLQRVASGERPELGEQVAVIGGGNTAIDAARTSLRLGAQKVMILYRRTETEMPAHPAEVHEARLEGVDIQFLIAPLQVLTGSDGRVSGIECRRMELGEPDSSGRRRPVPVAGSEFKIPLSTIIAAIGQQPDLSFLKTTYGEAVEVTKWSTIIADKQTLATSMPAVFAGGDAVLGAATAIEAMAHGRRAAYAIDAHLKELPLPALVIDDRAANSSKAVKLEDFDTSEYEGLEHIAKYVMPMLPEEERRLNHREVELGFPETAAKAEAKRCLACGCLDVFECELRRYAVGYDIKVEAFAGEIARHPIDRRHEFMVREASKCITCGRCVRACFELQGYGVLGFLNRGFAIEVGPAPGTTLDRTDCTSCGECIAVCPTGALMERFELAAPGPFEVEKSPSVCVHCGAGCEIDVNHVGGLFVRSTPRHERTAQQADLCLRGKFMVDFDARAERLTKPLVKHNGGLVPVSWKEALTTAAALVQDCLRAHGPEAVAVLAAPYLSNETAYLVQRLTRAVIGTPNLYLLRNPGAALQDSTAHPLSFEPQTDHGFQSHDAILVLDPQLEGHFPPVARALRRAAHVKSELFAFATYQSNLANESRLSVRLNAADRARAFTRLLKRTLEHRGLPIAETIAAQIPSPLVPQVQEWLREREYGTSAEARRLDAIAQRLLGATKPLLVLNRSRTSPAELHIASCLAKIMPAAVLALDEAANAQGLRALGIAPDGLPGRRSLSEAADRSLAEKIWRCNLPQQAANAPAELPARIAGGAVKLILIFGADEEIEQLQPFIGGSAATIMAALFDSAKLASANLVLPLASFAEESGSYTSSDGTERRTAAAYAPKSGMTNPELIAALARQLGAENWPDGLEPIRQEMASFLSR